MPLNVANWNKMLEQHIRRDDFDSFGSRRKLTWIPRDHEGVHPPNSILYDPPIQKGSGRFRGHGFSESPVGASSRFRSPGALESGLGSSERFRSSPAPESPMVASGRFRASGASDSLMGASGRFRASGASDSFMGASGRFRVSRSSESSLGMSGRFRASGPSEITTTTSGRFQSPGPPDPPLGSSGRSRVSGASDNPMGGSGRFRVLSDSSLGGSGRFRVFGIPESPAREFMESHKAIPESPARRGESVRRIRAPDIDAIQDKSILSTNASDNDVPRVSTNAADREKSSPAVNSVNRKKSGGPARSSNNDKSSAPIAPGSESSNRPNVKSTSNLSFIKPGRASHPLLVDTITESNQSEETEEQAGLDDSGLSSSGEKSIDDGSGSSTGLFSSGERSSDGTTSSSSSNFSTRTSFLAEKDRSTKPRDIQEQKPIPFYPATIAHPETNPNAILQKEIDGDSFLLGSPFLVEQSKTSSTSDDNIWGADRTTSSIMAQCVDKRRLESQTRSPPLCSGELEPEPEPEQERQQTLRSLPSTETPSQVSGELENPPTSKPVATKDAPTTVLDQKDSELSAASSPVGRTERADFGSPVPTFRRKDIQDVQMAIEQETGRRRRRSFNAVAAVDPASLSVLRVHRGNAKVAARSREAIRRMDPKTNGTDEQNQNLLNLEQQTEHDAHKPAAKAAADAQLLSNADGEAEAESFPKEQQKTMTDVTSPKEHQKVMNEGTTAKELQKQLYHHLHPLAQTQGGQLRSASARGFSARTRTPQRLPDYLEKSPVMLDGALNKQQLALHSQKHVSAAAVPHCCQCEVMAHPVYHLGENASIAHAKAIFCGATVPHESRRVSPFSRNPTDNMFSPSLSQEQLQMWNQIPGVQTEKKCPAVNFHRLSDLENSVHFSRVETPVSNSRRCMEDARAEPVNYMSNSTSQRLDPGVYRTPAQNLPGSDLQHPPPTLKEQLTGVHCRPESGPVMNDGSMRHKSKKGRSFSPGAQRWFFNPFRSKSNPKSKQGGDTGNNIKDVSSSTSTAIVAVEPVSVQPQKPEKTRKKSPWRFFHGFTGKSSKKNSGPSITAVAPVSDFRVCQSHRFASTRFEPSTKSSMSRMGLEAKAQQQQKPYRKSMSNLPRSSEAGSDDGPLLHDYIPAVHMQAMNGCDWASTPSHRVSLSHAQDGSFYISTPSHRFVTVDSEMVATLGRVSSGEVPSSHRLMLFEQQMQAGGNTASCNVDSPRNGWRMGSSETSGYSAPAFHRCSQIEYACCQTPPRPSLGTEVQGNGAHGMLTENAAGEATPVHPSVPHLDCRCTASHHLNQAGYPPSTPFHHKVFVDVAGDGTPIHRNAYSLPPVPSPFPATHTKGVQNFHNDFELRRG